MNLPHSSSEQQQLRSDVPLSKVVRTWRGRPWSVEYEVLKVKFVLLPINGQIKTLLCYRRMSYPAGGESYSLKSNHCYFTQEFRPPILWLFTEIDFDFALRLL